MLRSRGSLVVGLMFVALAAVAAGRSASAGSPSVTCVVRDGIVSVTATNSAVEVLTTSMAIERADGSWGTVLVDYASPWAVTWTGRGEFLAANPGAYIGKAVFDMGDHTLEVTGSCVFK